MGLCLMSVLSNLSHLILFPAMPVNFGLDAGHYIRKIVRSVDNLLSPGEDLFSLICSGVEVL